MDTSLIDRIVNALLYEGYILYPYRPSVKNHQRWAFGGVTPAAVDATPEQRDAGIMQTECLVAATTPFRLHVRVRFLHMTARTVRAIMPPQAAGPAGGAANFKVVPELAAGGQVYRPWLEAVERVVDPGQLPLAALAGAGLDSRFRFDGCCLYEAVADAEGHIAGELVREQHGIDGRLTVRAAGAGADLWRVSVRIQNLTPADLPNSHDDGMMVTLASTHTTLEVEGGAFVSLLDPPESAREAAAACKNVGTWPVHVGKDGDRRAMLSSPITLYDYPTLAPESPGDLYDATEIDEILTLRILTMTDEEKRQMAQIDERARLLLERTEALTPAQLGSLHGTLRNPHAQQREPV